MSELPLGTVVMFYGKSIPNGWLLCNGENGTPDLVDKFILGGAGEDVGGNGRGKPSGAKDQKSMSVTTSQMSTGISIAIEDHAITLDQMPSHKHSSTVSIDSGWWSVTSAGSSNHSYQGVGVTNAWTPFPIGYSGGGKGHSHNAKVQDPKHNHTLDIMPSYYILAYIIYVG
ncbi:phage tail protein [Serratia ficaria]|uniref:phage tail protein n=1 Tax=Serratia ficaria TaxID=61651 RepID=UPI002178EB9C|nr:phage tail protein [Serratia ficaria]CAI1123927.1 Uncharacterised protein [Serratia ficaria]CAI1541632.1 Uncharacterised protein [Serratia ficaria]CAI2534368.1 Uncharacterised protein [Serratia ficaria]CAI2539044.1 Uncharacterised protein [Serratia ficaria]